MEIKRFRDYLPEWVPWWLSDRHYKFGETQKTVGYRYIWVIVAMLDYYVEYALQALRAPWPGKGTASALPYIGRSRGIVRGQADSDASFSAKLIRWLEKWQSAGSQRQLAIELHEYLGNSPRIRIVNRAGFMTSVAADGTVTTNTIAWNWDGTSNPERSSFWSELWIIVYPTQWAIEPTWGTAGTWGAGDGTGFGHAASRIEVDAVKGIVDQWKSAHSKVRAIIWTSDATLFDPTNPASLPNGNWGTWGVAGVASSRNVATCRYWEL